MGSKKSNEKISKIDFALALNRAFAHDDMEALMDSIASYMYYAELTVSSETIMRFSEDGLIVSQNGSNIDQWPYKSGDEED